MHSPSSPNPPLFWLVGYVVFGSKVKTWRGERWGLCALTNNAHGCALIRPHRDRLNLADVCLRRQTSLPVLTCTLFPQLPDCSFALAYQSECIRRHPNCVILFSRLLLRVAVLLALLRARSNETTTALTLLSCELLPSEEVWAPHRCTTLYIALQGVCADTRYTFCPKATVTPKFCARVSQFVLCRFAVLLLQLSLLWFAFCLGFLSCRSCVC